VALLVTSALASCGGAARSSAIVDRDGIGAFATGSPWGVNKTIVKIGQPWSAGSVTLCKKSQADEVVLQGIAAESVAGQIRLDGIGVRTTLWGKKNRPSNPNTHLVGTRPGVPNGLHDPAGFTVVTTCPSPKAPVGEIVVTLTKTGPKGGALDGLKVDYEDNSELHELVINFHYGLCGTGEFAVPCRGT
jgi:hypothetical protein